MATTRPIPKHKTPRMARPMDKNAKMIICPILFLPILKLYFKASEIGNSVNWIIKGYANKTMDTIIAKTKTKTIIITTFAIVNMDINSLGSLAKPVKKLAPNNAIIIKTNGIKNAKPNNIKTRLPKNNRPNLDVQLKKSLNTNSVFLPERLAAAKIEAERMNENKLLIEPITGMKPSSELSIK